MNRNKSVLLSSIMLFIACMSIGLWLASIKPLWNDEQYSEASYKNRSYLQIIKGDLPEAQGHVGPLYYIIQKFIRGIFR